MKPKDIDKAVTLAHAVIRERDKDTPESLLEVSRGLVAVAEREADLRNLLARALTLTELLGEDSDDAELVEQVAQFATDCASLPAPVGMGGG